MRVLLPEGGSRQVLPMAKALRELGAFVVTVQESRSDLGNVSRYPSRKYVVPGVDTDRLTAIAEYRRILRDEGVDLVIPLSDFSADVFSEMREELESGGKLRIAVPRREVFAKAFDKLETMRVCMENGIPCPLTLGEVFSIDDVPEDLKYPVVVKPRSASGSIGFHCAQNRDELGRQIAKTLNDGLGNVLVQEFIPQTGRQYNAHFVIDSNHEVKTAVLAEKCRWFPLDGGASTLCRTIHNGKILDVCAKLLGLIGWVGYCDLDLMEDPRDGSVRIIEINARISANVKLCFAAGVDVAKQLLQLYFGDSVDSCLGYRDDVRLRCLHTDLLWFLKSPNRFRSKPSWFSSARTTDQIFSWSDLPVFFSFSAQALRKYRSEMRKRER